MIRRILSILKKRNVGHVVNLKPEETSKPLSAINLYRPLESSVCKGSQILLQLKYRELVERGDHLPLLQEVEFRNFSENGEDGILLYIFSLIGATNSRVVEICAGDGRQCNAANLVIHHGWEGLLFDGDAQNVEKGKNFFSTHPDTKNWPPEFVNAWITADNVNKLVAEAGFAGEVDLLSLDIDGQDYWVWKALDIISPRVVLLEYQDILGPDSCLTVPYNPKFIAEFGPYGPDYCGASLGAFVKLGKKKGYRLIGCQRYGYNAFFLRNDVGQEVFPEIPAKDCFIHPKVRFGIERRYPKVSQKEWVKV